MNVEPGGPDASIIPPEEGEGQFQPIRKGGLRWVFSYNGRRGTQMKLRESKVRAVVKRIADAYEKLGVASLAVGLFQNIEAGLWIGAGCLATSIIITAIQEK